MIEISLRVWSGFGQVVDSTRSEPALAAQTAAHANFLDAACSKFKLIKPFLYAQAVHLRFPAIPIGVQTFQYPLLLFCPPCSPTLV